MEYKDYYKILGVGKTADEAEIRKAYRNKARQYHPDRNPGDKAAEETFKEVNEAYEVLSDADNRRKYDQLGSAYFRYQQAGGAPDFSDFFRNSGYGGQNINLDDLINGMGGAGGFSSFFETMFGQGAPGYGGAQPVSRDTEQPVDISLEEAFHGTSRTLVDTNGERFTVRIPAGIQSGKKVRFRGKGGQGGDLFLVVNVKPHPRYKVEGELLRTQFDVDVVTAVLGGEVIVPTLLGDVKLKVPAGTQGGRSFRLKGRGMPKLREKGTFGDLIAQVRIRVPDVDSLSAEERSLYEQLATLRDGMAV